MGLIVITLLLAFLLMLDALRSQISVHRNHAGTTKQNKEKKSESRQEQIVSKALEHDEPLIVMGQTNWKKKIELQEDETSVKKK